MIWLILYILPIVFYWTPTLYCFLVFKIKFIDVLDYVLVSLIPVLNWFGLFCIVFDKITEELEP